LVYGITGWRKVRAAELQFIRMRFSKSAIAVPSFENDDRCPRAIEFSRNDQATWAATDDTDVTGQHCPGSNVIAVNYHMTLP
jgi:hypothetical protein